MRGCAFESAKGNRAPSIARIFVRPRIELRATSSNQRRKRNDNLYVATIDTDDKSSGAVFRLKLSVRIEKRAEESYPDRLGCPLFLDNYILLSLRNFRNEFQPRTTVAGLVQTIAWPTALASISSFSTLIEVRETERCLSLFFFLTKSAH